MSILSKCLTFNNKVCVIKRLCILDPSEFSSLLCPSPHMAWIRQHTCISNFSIEDHKRKSNLFRQLLHLSMRIKWVEQFWPVECENCPCNIYLFSRLENCHGMKVGQIGLVCRHFWHINTKVYSVDCRLCTWPIWLFIPFMPIIKSYALSQMSRHGILATYNDTKEPLLTVLYHITQVGNQ